MSVQFENSSMNELAIANSNKNSAIIEKNLHDGTQLLQDCNTIFILLSALKKSGVISNPIITNIAQKITEKKIKIFNQKR